MRFYADATITLDSSTMRADDDAARGILDDECSTMRSHVLDAARDNLIAMGMLEQTTADGEHVTCVSADRCPSGARTQAWAHRLADAWLGTSRRPMRDTTSTAPGIDHGFGEVRAVLPEGYLFYSVYPEWYVTAGLRLGLSLSPRPVVVIGLRSIGTSLSAAVAAGLYRAGCSFMRYTARPQGQPFERTLAPNRTVAQAWRRAAERGADFVIVDEGPGLSGSSLAAAVTALERCGVETHRIHVVCATPPVNLPMAGATVRATWARVHWSAAETHMEPFWQATLPELLGPAIGRTLTYRCDLSWGAWTAHRRASPPVLPQLERRKLLLECDGRQVVAKFIGFGQVGRRKAQLALQLAGAGFIPPVLGHAHGMLMQEWLPGSGELQAGETTQRTVLRAAQYYAHLRLYCATGTPADVDTAAECARDVSTAWFGTSTTMLPRLRDAARAAGATGGQGDQRPGCVEWTEANGSLLKCDAADHFLDHSWARDQDVCFDLAGFMQEFELAPAQRTLLVERYISASGDATVHQRLPFYHIVYAAHRLATFDLAYHAAQPAHRATIDMERQRLGNVLGGALYGKGEPCVS